MYRIEVAQQEAVLGTGDFPLEGLAAAIRDQCMGAGVAFFFKQWGGTCKKKAGRELEGRTWSQIPSFAT